METKKKGVTEPSPLKKLYSTESIYYDYEFPKVSIIIPTFNSSLALPLTLESLFKQRYPDFEIIAVDSGSTDRTIEIIKGYREDRVSIYSVSTFERYEMLNKGISQSHGVYLNFLFPGDYYLSSDVLMNMMTLALDHHMPHLVYSGSLLRYGRREPSILFKNLNHTLLRRGQMPTSLQSCWFKRELFREIGKFDASLTLRGGYELLCRFERRKELKSVCTTRVTTDYDIRVLTRKLVITHLIETGGIVFKYYGLLAFFTWFRKQKGLSRYFGLWWHSIKVALIGTKHRGI